MVPHWQTPYLGTRYLPKRLSDWEIDHFFTLEPDERDDICKRFRNLNRLAVALQLGFLRMTGCTLDGVRILPKNLLEHLGAQLDIDTPTIASVRALYRRTRTRYDHQQWAMDRLGFVALGIATGFLRNNAGRGICTRVQYSSALYSCCRYGSRIPPL